MEGKRRPPNKGQRKKEPGHGGDKLSSQKSRGFTGQLRGSWPWFNLRGEGGERGEVNGGKLDMGGLNFTQVFVLGFFGLLGGGVCGFWLGLGWVFGGLVVVVFLWGVVGGMNSLIC